MGILLMLATIPAGFAALMSAIVEMGQKQNQWLPEQFIAAMGTLLVILVALLAMTWSSLLKPATLCVGCRRMYCTCKHPIT